MRLVEVVLLLVVIVVFGNNLIFGFGDIVYLIILRWLNI